MNETSPLRLEAHAKLNWDLCILGQRADGFHELDSVFVTIGLSDRLTIAPAGDLAMTCTDPALPCDGRNLVLGAAAALRSAAACPRGAHIHLEKHIPPGGGLGGGSSDAAAVLDGLNRFWNLSWPRERLASLAAGLGSDVPYFLRGGWQRCQGRGERIAPLPGASELPSVRCLLVIPPLSVPTPAVYRALRAPAWDGRPPARTVEGIAATLRENLQRLASGEPLRDWPRNDLTAAARAVEPGLAAVQEVLEREFPARWQMSGSGAAHFALPRAGETADALQAAFRARGRGTTRVIEVNTRA